MAELPALDRRTVQRKTVQEFDDAGTPTFILQFSVAADEVPRWWSTTRDRWLDEFWKTEPFLASAISSVATRNAAFRYEFEGPPAQVEWAQELFAQADFGNGWQQFIVKVSLDYLTLDNGAFIEVIRPSKVKQKGRWYPAVKMLNSRGSPAWYAIKGGTPTALRGNYKVVDSPFDLPIGLAHLDSRRCTRTGDPNFPILYTDLDGRVHKIAFHQVMMLNEMPSPRKEMRGVGFCAVSRVLRAAQILRDFGIYKHEKISGRFARAVHITNADATATQDAIIQAEENADNRGQTRYIQPIVVSTLDPATVPQVVTIELASLPDGFDEEATLRWYITNMAMGLGVDYGFLAPLPGNKLGTATQAETQERQSRGKSSRLFMQALTYKFNYFGILPKTVQFRFSEQDASTVTERDVAQSRRAQTRATRIQSEEITPEIARQIAHDDGDLKARYLESLEEVDVTPSVVVAGDEMVAFKEGEHVVTLKKKTRKESRQS